MPATVFGTTIAQHYFDSFSDEIVLQAQQVDSKLLGLVTIEHIDGEKRFFDAYGTADWSERLAYNAQNNYSDIRRDRRFISRRDFEHSHLFDPREDSLVKHAMEPGSQYMAAVMAGWGRQVDAIIIPALTATAFSGQTGTTPEPFDTAMVVAQNVAEVPAGAANAVTGDVEIGLGGLGATDFLNLGKIRSGIRKLVDRNVQLEDITLLVHPVDFDAVRDQNRATSADYSTMQMLDDLTSRQRTTLFGINVVMTTEIPTDGGGLRDSYLFTKRSMVAGIDAAPRTSLDTIPHLGHARQLSVYADVAASRRFEDEVVQIINVAPIV